MRAVSRCGVAERKALLGQYRRRERSDHLCPCVGGGVEQEREGDCVVERGNEVGTMSELGTVLKKVDYDLAGLLHHVDIGGVGLPEIQRPFVGPLPRRETFSI